MQIHEMFPVFKRRYQPSLVLSLYHKSRRPWMLLLYTPEESMRLVPHTYNLRKPASSSGAPKVSAPGIGSAYSSRMSAGSTVVFRHEHTFVLGLWHVLCLLLVFTYLQGTLHTSYSIRGYEDHSLRVEARSVGLHASIGRLLHVITRAFPNLVTFPSLL